MGTLGIASNNLTLFAFAFVAILAFGAFVTAFAFLWFIIVKETVRADADGASPIDAFFAFGTMAV